MVSVSKQSLCAKCTKTGCTAMCCGCQQPFCTRHFIKHRLSLSQQMDDLHQKYLVFQQDVNRDRFQHPLLTNIYTWERESIRKIQEIAEKARKDLQEWMERTKSEVQSSLHQINSEFESNAQLDNFTEVDLQKWTKQLEQLRNSLEQSPTLSIVEDKKALSSLRAIKITEQKSQPSCSSLPTESPVVSSCELVPEQFVAVFGPCKLSEENSVVTQSSYRAGLSQISSVNHYSSGKHSVDFLIEKKGAKNMFIGLHSSSARRSSSMFDNSLHGWWNLDYVIINGECEGGDSSEVIQCADKLTLIIDCDQQRIQLEHHRTKRLVHIPIKLDVCPFPWKILVRLLNEGDCIRILK